MRNFTDFAIRQEYERIKELGDKLVEIRNKINWEDIRPKLEVLFDNKTERGGRSHRCYCDAQIAFYPAALQPLR